jgi:hypothetical protein
MKRKDIPQWNLDELVARYEYEPELTDVFVEGVHDKEVLSEFFKKTSGNKWVVYEIDVVKIPSEILEQNKLTCGNKSQVIAVARLLGKIEKICGYRCVVDRDLDHWFGLLESTRRLVWTEYCSIELYFFTEEIVRDILITTARSRIPDWGMFFRSFINTLQQLYLLRLAAFEAGWAINWLSFDRCLIVIRGEMVFDLHEYVHRLLLANNRYADIAAFIARSEAWQSKCVGDPRNQIRGHDFVDLLAWVIGNFNGVKSFASELAVRRIFILLASRITEFANLVC